MWLLVDVAFLLFVQLYISQVFCELVTFWVEHLKRNSISEKWDKWYHASMCHWFFSLFAFECVFFQIMRELSISSLKSWSKLMFIFLICKTSLSFVVAWVAGVSNQKKKHVKGTKLQVNAKNKEVRVRSGNPLPLFTHPSPHFSPFLHTSGLLDLSAWKRRKQEQTNYSFLNFVWSRICLLHGIEISSNSTDDKKTWKTTNYFLNFLVFPFSSGFANIIPFTKYIRLIFFFSFLC